MYANDLIEGGHTFLFFPIFDKVGRAVRIRHPVKWPGLACLGVLTSPPHPETLPGVFFDNLLDLPPSSSAGAGIFSTSLGP